MDLQCPNCGGFIPAENINIQETLALCNDCGQVFDFRDSAVVRKEKPRKVKQPGRLQVSESDRYLAMTFRQVLNPDDKKTLALCIFLTLFMVASFILAVTDYASPTIMALIEAPPVAVFLYAIAMLLGNATQVVLDDKTLAVQYGPLPRIPFPPTTEVEPKTLSRDRVVRVFCEETEKSRNSGSLNRYYHLCAQMVTGQPVILLKSLPQDYAHYMAQMLEERLHFTIDHTQAGYDDDFFEDTEQDNIDVVQLAHLLVNDKGGQTERNGSCH